MNDHKTSTPTLVSALRILAGEIQSDDGVANMTIAEAADRIEELVEYYGEALAIERNRAEQAEQRNVELVAALRNAVRELARVTVVTDGHPSVSHNLMYNLRGILDRAQISARAESATPAKYDTPPRSHCAESKTSIPDYLRDYAEAIDIGESQEQATHAQWLRKAADAIEATPAKHPDTVRLDWLEAAPSERLAEVRRVLWQQHNTCMATRAAIDAARKQGGAT